MNKELKRNEFKNNELKNLLLLVNGKVQENYKVYLGLIPLEQRIQMNWLNSQFLPTIIFTPVLAFEQDNVNFDQQKQVSAKLAVIIELMYLAQEIHSHVPDAGQKNDYQMSVLIGDYLCATAFGYLVKNQQNKWMERLGSAICRMNEGKIAKSQWKDKNFVPMSKKVENLHKEFGELTALAGLMGADVAGLNPEETQIYTAFAFYTGIIQGIILNSYHLDKSDCLEEYFSYCRQYALLLPQGAMQNLAFDLLAKLNKAAENTGWNKSLPNLVEFASNIS